MEIFGTLPTWAIVLLALLAAAALVALNIGWFLQARGMVEQLRRQREERERRSQRGRSEADREREAP